MNRTDLIQHLRPLVERTVTELAGVLWDRLEHQLDDALEAARSALASDVAGPAAEIAPHSTRGPLHLAPEPPVVPVALASPQAAVEPRRSRISKPVASGEVQIPAPDKKREPHNKGGQMVCTVCREPGHNARRHKREVPVGEETVEPKPLRVEPSAAPSYKPPSDTVRASRFAALEAAAERRRAEAGR